jgi:hypothetical protein
MANKEVKMPRKKGNVLEEHQRKMRQTQLWNDKKIRKRWKDYRKATKGSVHMSREDWLDRMEAPKGRTRSTARHEEAS